MKQITFIGIDVSAATLDISIKTNQSQEHETIANKLTAIRKFFKKYAGHDLIVAMENTGHYNWILYEALTDATFPVYVINPLHLKKSIGLARGKNDKVDAARIADFISKNYQDLQCWKPESLSIRKLKALLTERKYRIKLKRQLLSKSHDYKLMKKLGLDKEFALNEKLKDQLEDQIKKLEKKIEQIIREDSQLKNQSKLIKSVPGVGKVLSWMLLAKTDGFKNIDSARKMACYSGVAPFDHQSGSSIYRKPKVSVYADKLMKTTLHLAAMSAVRLDNELRVYYQRKVAEGKSKMSVLNAVRNKILHRVYAVIKNQREYQKFYLAVS